MPKPSKRRRQASVAGSTEKRRKDNEEKESEGGRPVMKGARDLSVAFARVLQENVEPREDEGTEVVVEGIESSNVEALLNNQSSVDRFVEDVCPNVSSLTMQTAYGGFVTPSVRVSRGDGQQNLTRFFPRAERIVETVDRIVDRDETESLDSSFISEGGFSDSSRYSGGSNTSARLAEKAEKRRLAAVRAVEVVSAPVNRSSRKRSRKIDKPTNPYLVLKAEDDESNQGESDDYESSVVDDSSFVPPSSFVVTRKRGRCSSPVGVVDDASSTTSMAVVKAKRSRNELVVDDRSSVFGGFMMSSMGTRCSARLAARQRRNRNVLSSSISVGENTRAWVESTAVSSVMNSSFSDLSLGDEEQVEEVSDSHAEETAVAGYDKAEYCSRLHRLVNRVLNPAEHDDRIQMCLCTDEDNPVSSGSRFQEGDFTQAELRVLVENDGDEWLEANLVYKILLSCCCYGENGGDMVVLDLVIWEPYCVQMEVGERPIDRALNYSSGQKKLPL